MGFSFRKSVKLGSLGRLNFSTRGVGISVGVRGARTSVGPRGTYVSLGTGGFQYRAKVSATGRRNARKESPPSTLPRDEQTVEVVQGLVNTASVAALAEKSFDASLANIETRINRFSVFWLYVLGALALIGLLSMPDAATGEANPRPTPPLLAITAIVGGVLVYRWDRDRCTASIAYDLEDQELRQRAALANSVGKALSNAAQVWHVWASRPSDDRKHNGGANQLMQRTPVAVRDGSLPRIEINIDAWSIPVGPQQLLFLPDRLLVFQDSRLAGVPYEILIARASRTRFVETEPLPRDAPVVGRTWRYVNKKGGRDGRFKDNPELPITEYGILELTTPTGLQIVLQTSNPEAAQITANTINELTQRAAPAAHHPRNLPSA